MHVVAVSMLRYVGITDIKKSEQKKIVWELIYIFAGGLAVGTLITQSGAADALGRLLASTQIENNLVLIFAIIVLTIVLSDLTSNMATAAVTIPIVLTIAIAMNLDSIPYMLAASVGVNLSYCMPTFVREVPVGYALPPNYMFKHGIKLTVIVVALMTVLVWIDGVLGVFWDGLEGCSCISGTYYYKNYLKNSGSTLV